MVTSSLFVLLAVFLLVSAAEFLRPRRVLLNMRRHRWTTHALFFLTNAATGRLLAFVVAIPIAAQWSEAQGFGLLRMLSLPGWAELLIAFIVLDFAVWLQHLAMHKIPLLWRMHKVHHVDRDLDVTTALRFHPFELVVSTLYKSAWVVVLGVPAAVALAFEAWLNANALFNHGNIRLPRKLDALVRWLLVTPDMHLVHHSTVEREQHCNYGFALTIWDRLFGCYLTESANGSEQQTIGLSNYTDDRPTRFGWSLKFPLT